MLGCAAVSATACGPRSSAAAVEPAPLFVPTPTPGARPARDPVDEALATLSAERLLADVRWLAADDLHGRGSYSHDARRVAGMLAERFAEAGLSVLRQPIASTGQDNVMGVLSGTGEVVLLVAHYDHLGETDGQMFPGADDNASGVAVLLALARALGKTHRGHTIVFLATGAEEDKLRGSLAYVQDPPWALDRTRALINFDMVGRDFLESAGGWPNTVAAVGAESSAPLYAAVEAAGQREQVRVVFVATGMVKLFGIDARTDDYWFRERGVPTVHFSTGMHPDYHRATDTPDRLKPAQLLRVARLATRTLVDIGALKLAGQVRPTGTAP